MAGPHAPSPLSTSGCNGDRAVLYTGVCCGVAALPWPDVDVAGEKPARAAAGRALGGVGNFGVGGLGGVSGLGEVRRCRCGWTWETRRRVRTQGTNAGRS